MKIKDRKSAARELFRKPPGKLEPVDLTGAQFIPTGMTRAYRNNRYTVMIYDNTITTIGMKYVWLFLLVLPMLAWSQKDSSDMEKRLREYDAAHPYWTIWFRLSKPSAEFERVHDSVKCSSCDSLKYHPHEEWVQSFSDITQSYEYYWHLRRTGKVLMWGKYECEVDKSSVYIDKYDMVIRKYVGIKQPE